ncbi:MAG: ribonucleoside triphosphate reductase, partial [Spirochaetaceae bacterium]|nr:ribonucleoside triphosphate reductase [Spirochaetaceae bacterium]
GGLFPYTRRYLSKLDNHFNTIGLCGMNECCLNFLGCDIVSKKGKEFAERVLAHMRERLADYQEESGELFNLEATPAESTSYRLARHDKANYPDIITSGENDPYYTNSSQLPVDYTSDIFDAMDHQESLQTKYTGGTVFHTFMGESIKDWKACRDLVRTVTANYRIPYITISPTFSVCKIHGYLDGEHFECPLCKQEAERKLRAQLAELEQEKAAILASS